MADSGFAPAESIIYAFCSNNDCQLHSVDVGMTPEEWNQRALPAINPEPPTVAVTWHDSPESVHRAMWEESAVAAGMTYEQMVDESVSCGEDEHGNEIEFTHEQEIAGMRQQGCWAFVDARSNIIRARADESASREFVLHMLAHEIGHITGDAHTDYFQEEMRAEQFGRVAKAAYRLLPPINTDYAALEAERDALRAEISDLHTTMMAAAVEIQEHWAAHCDEDGYGPANLMHRLERGIASQYGYTAQALVRLEAERDAMRQQRDKLAGLLREVNSAYTTAIHWEDMRATMAQIRTALSELTP